MDPFIGEIKMFAGGFAPAGWLACDGQTLAIQQYSALFAIIGITYGGNGSSNFCLPDLRSRVPLHAGAAAGLTSYHVGEKGGTEQTTLTLNNLPAHNHAIMVKCSSSQQTSTETSPVGNVAGVTDATQYAAAANGTANMAQPQCTPVGNGAAFSNQQPFLCVEFIIAYQGIFPTRE
jgi:microcystin-dependent protein